MAEASERWLSEEMSDAKYEAKADAADTYLAKADAADTYLAKADAADDYRPREDDNIIVVNGVRNKYSGSLRVLDIPVTTTTAAIFNSGNIPVELPSVPNGYTRLVTYSTASWAGEWIQQVTQNATSVTFRVYALTSRTVPVDITWIMVANS